MIDLSIARLEGLAIHFVGNKFREEKLFISQEPIEDLDEDEEDMLLKYFLKSFNTEEIFRFTHPSDLELNEIYSFATKLFERPGTFGKQSKNIANHLYSCSTHPKIKGGELYVAYFSHCIVDGKEVEAIGLFKTESKEKYLDATLKKEAYRLNFHEGVPLGKVEKGCLIFNSAEEGLSVCVVDSKSNEALYWTNDFLNVTPQSNSFHQTKTYLKICQEFVTAQLPEVVDVTKADQIDLMNRSVEYFKSNTELNMKEFEEEIFEEPEVRKSFKNFRKNFEKENDTAIEDGFEISTKAVKRQAQVFKSVLKLDKNFHIYIHGDKQLIEKGFDPETGKHFYKIYFDNEL
ncbi:nucleoid-associated protein [soil metagenome]